MAYNLHKSAIKRLNAYNMKQTAVEWFIKKIAEDYPEIPKAYREECNKAKEMEKEQIIESYLAGKWDEKFTDRKSEEFYEQTYEKK